MGAGVRDRPADRDRPPRRGHAARSPRPPGAPTEPRSSKSARTRRARTRASRSTPPPSGGCGIAIIPPETWTVGDNINRRSARATCRSRRCSSRSPTPRSPTAARSSNPTSGSTSSPPSGTVLKTIDPSPLRHLDINPSDLDAVREGLRAAASQPGGTSADVFGRLPRTGLRRDRQRSVQRPAGLRLVRRLRPRLRDKDPDRGHRDRRAGRVRRSSPLPPSPVKSSRNGSSGNQGPGNPAAHAPFSIELSRWTQGLSLYVSADRSTIEPGPPCTTSGVGVDLERALIVGRFTGRPSEADASYRRAGAPNVRGRHVFGADAVLACAVGGLP